MANSVRIRVGVDDNATKPIRNIHDAWKRLQVDGAKGLGLGIGAGAGLAAWSLAGRAISGVTDALGDSVKAAIEEDVGIRRLTTSLEANVPAFDGNTEAIERRIAAGERLGFSDNAQRDALALLVVATKDVAAAHDLMATAEDLARLKGIGLVQASEALIRVEAGQFRMLKSLGIELRDGATQQEALAAVQKAAAGQAEEYGKTTAGAMERANVAIGNLSEEIGGALMPVVEGLANVLVDDVIPGLKGAAIAISGVEQAARDAAGPVADFVDSFTPDEGFDWRDLFHEDNRPKSIEALAQEFAVLAGITETTGAVTRDFVAGEREAARAADVAAASLREAGEGANVTAGRFDDLDANARGAGEGVAALTDGVGELVDELARIERNITIDIAYRIHTAPFINPNAPPGSADANRANAFSSGGDEDALAQADQNFQTRDRLAKERQAENERRAEEGRRRAEQASNEAERKAAERQREAERKAAEARKDGYDLAKRAAREYFDDLHEMNLKAIDDERDLANVKIDEQERAIRSTLTAEQKRIAGMRDAEQEAGLRADVAGATDPGELASAQKALNRFLQDKRLDFLGDRTDEQIAGLDKQRDANDVAAEGKFGKENTRAEIQRDKFDRLIEAMEKQKQPIQLVLDGKVIGEYVADYLAGRSSVVAPRKVSTSSVR